MKILITIPVLCLLLVFIFGCQTSSNKLLDTKELENYFETTEIETLAKGKTLEVIISNSEFIRREHQKKQTKWSTAEAFSSIGALIVNHNLNNNKIDTTILSLKFDNAKESYKYSVLELKQIEKYTNNSIQFLNAWGRKDFHVAQSYLGKEILNIYPTVEEIKKALSPVFLTNSINKSELIAFKISDNVVSLYINAYYDNNAAQTYIFNFFLLGDGKIVGITVP